MMFCLCHEQEAALRGSWWNCYWTLVVEAADPSVGMGWMKMELADGFVGDNYYHLRNPSSRAQPNILVMACLTPTA